MGEDKGGDIKTRLLVHWWWSRRGGGQGVTIEARGPQNEQIISAQVVGWGEGKGGDIMSRLLVHRWWSRREGECKE